MVTQDICSRTCLPRKVSIDINAALYITPTSGVYLPGFVGTGKIKHCCLSMPQRQCLYIQVTLAVVRYSLPGGRCCCLTPIVKARCLLNVIFNVEPLNICRIRVRYCQHFAHNGVFDPHCLHLTLVVNRVEKGTSDLVYNLLCRFSSGPGGVISLGKSSPKARSSDLGLGATSRSSRFSKAPSSSYAMQRRRSEAQ